MTALLFPARRFGLLLLAMRAELHRVEGNRIRLSRKAILKEQRAKMAAEGGIAPAHWPLECANGIRSADRRGRLDAAGRHRLERIESREVEQWVDDVVAVDEDTIADAMVRAPERVETHIAAGQVARATQAEAVVGGAADFRRHLSGSNVEHGERADDRRGPQLRQPGRSRG